MPRTNLIVPDEETEEDVDEIDDIVARVVTKTGINPPRARCRSKHITDPALRAHILAKFPVRDLTGLNKRQRRRLREKVRARKALRKPAGRVADIEITPFVLRGSQLRERRSVRVRVPRPNIQTLDIPNGTLVEKTNFAQANAGPNTSYITGTGLVFRHCNLINVQLDPTWIIQESNTAQIRYETLPDGTIRSWWQGRLIIDGGVVRQVDADGNDVTPGTDLYLIKEKAPPVR
jgi:hypothetical protein